MSKREFVKRVLFLSLAIAMVCGMIGIQTAATRMNKVGPTVKEEFFATYTTAGKDAILQAFDMSDDIWANTAVIRNFYRMGSNGLPAVYDGIDTNLRMLWDEQYLYIAYECMDGNISDMIFSEQLDEKGSWFVGKSDDVETFITTSPTGELFGYFSNPAGLAFRYRKMPSAAKADFDATDCDYASTAKRMDDRWVAIQAISFKGLGITDAVTAQTAIYAYFYRGFYLDAKSSQIQLAWNGAGTWQSSATRQIQLLAQGEVPPTQPTEPETQPTQPATKPTQPETQPSESGAEATQPSVPAAQPGGQSIGVVGSVLIGLAVGLAILLIGGAVVYVLYRKKVI